MVYCTIFAFSLQISTGTRWDLWLLSFEPVSVICPVLGSRLLLGLSAQFSALVPSPGPLAFISTGAPIPPPPPLVLSHLFFLPPAATTNTEASLKEEYRPREPEAWGGVGYLWENGTHDTGTYARHCAEDVVATQQCIIESTLKPCPACPFLLNLQPSSGSEACSNDLSSEMDRSKWGEGYGKSQGEQTLPIFFEGIRKRGRAMYIHRQPRMSCICLSECACLYSVIDLFFCHFSFSLSLVMCLTWTANNLA